MPLTDVKLPPKKIFPPPAATAYTLFVRLGLKLGSRVPLSVVLTAAARLRAVPLTLVKSPTR